MLKIILVGALAALAAPAFAMDPMSCADFTAMDAAGQAKTVADMGDGMMAGGGMMAASDTAMTPADTAKGLAGECAGHPDMMLDEAMGMLPH